MLYETFSTLFLFSFSIRILRVIFTLSIVTTSIIFFYWMSGGDQEKSYKYLKQPQILMNQETADFLRETHGRGESFVDQSRNCMISKSSISWFNDSAGLWAFIKFTKVLKKPQLCIEIFSRPTSFISFFLIISTVSRAEN